MKLWQPPNFQKHGIAGFFSEKINKLSLRTLNFPTFFPKQVHSDKIILLYPQSDISPSEGDGVISLKRELFIGVQTSDCVPILLADKRKRFAAAIHAGWRGTLKGILSKALQKIIDMGIRPEEILLALGPHIQSTCYEVKEDVIAYLKAPFNKNPYVISENNTFYLNLAALNLSQAKEYNIPLENIWVSEECTHCLKEKYHSYRRERDYSYTQIALISSSEFNLD